MVTRMPKRRRRYSLRKGLGSVAIRRRRRVAVACSALIVVIGAFLAIVAVQVTPAERIYVASLDATFATSMNPIAKETNYTGSELSSMLKDPGNKLVRATFVANLDAMVGDANQAVTQFETLTPPGNLSRPASECLSALRARANGLATFRTAIAAVLADPPGDAQSAPSAESSIDQVRSVLSSSDSSWSVCRQGVLEAPYRGRNALPESVWVGSKTQWGQVALAGFVSDIASIVTSATQPISILAVSIDPPSVVTIAGSDVLPTTSRVSVHVVVRNMTNTEEPNVAVKVSLVPTQGASSASGVHAESTAALAGGQAASFHPAALEVSAGTPYELEVTATESGGGVSVTRRYRISIAPESGTPKV
jgi:hypothetical protein